LPVACAKAIIGATSISAESINRDFFIKQTIWLDESG